MTDQVNDEVNLPDNDHQSLNFFGLLLTLFLIGVIFVGLGTLISVAITLLYVNSSLFCRDCDTGLGLCCIGFCFSGVLTPLIWFYGRKLIIRSTEKGET